MLDPITILTMLAYAITKRAGTDPTTNLGAGVDLLAQLFGGAAGNAFYGDLEKLRATFLTITRPDSNQDLERAAARSSLHASLFCLMEALGEPLEPAAGNLAHWRQCIADRLPDTLRDLRRPSEGFFKEADRSQLLKAKKDCEAQLEQIETSSFTLVDIAPDRMLVTVEAGYDRQRAKEALELIEEKHGRLPDQAHEIFLQHWFKYLCGSFHHEIKSNQPVANILMNISLARVERKIEEGFEKLSQRFAETQQLIHDTVDIFRPLAPPAGGRRAIGRFLELSQQNRIYFDPKVSEGFGEILGSQPLALISGASGSGKTVTTLALSERFDGGAWRVFYVDLHHQITEQQLVNGVRQRSNCPTIFVFDDAHLKLDLVQRSLDRLADILGSGQVRLVLVLQGVGIVTNEYEGPTRDFIEECVESKAVIELATTEAHYQAIIARSRPDLTLSREQLRRLYALSGGSLMLLDEILTLLHAESDVDGLDLDMIFPRVLRRYFQRPQGVFARDLKRLAALAQFDVAVPVADLRDPFEPHWSEAVDRFTFTFGRPASRGFFHTSAAELLFRALSWADGDNDWVQAATDVWVERICSVGGLTNYRLKPVDSFATESRSAAEAA